jgi:hypothetical protein
MTVVVVVGGGRWGGDGRVVSIGKAGGMEKPEGASRGRVA